MSAIEYRGVSFGYPDGPDALARRRPRGAAGDVLLVVGIVGLGQEHAAPRRERARPALVGRSVRRRRRRVRAQHPHPPAARARRRRRLRRPGSRGAVRGRPRRARRRVRAREPRDARRRRCAGGSRRCSTRSASRTSATASPATLSGGERQRVAIAGALAAAPSALVLDEPTSQLDPQGADDVLAAVGRLNADLGTTVLLAEHRLERAAPLAHRRGASSRTAASVAPGTPRAVLAEYPGAPPVVAPRPAARVGTRSPLTVRDARAHALADRTVARPVEP